VLEVKQLSKMFENKRGVVGIDFSMNRGEIVGFLGPNGAGKTTTMRMITGYLYPTNGEILVDGISMNNLPRAARRKIGYLPQVPPVYPELTVWSYMKFIADLREIPRKEQNGRIEEVLTRLGFEGREQQVIRGLSQGFKQRLGLAQAIVHNPELLILDEPTSGLDPKQIIEVRDLIRDLSKERTILLSTHILQEVNSICNRVLIINEGKMVMDGNTDDIMHSTKEGFEVSLTVIGPQAGVLRAINACDQVKSAQMVARQANDDDRLSRVKVNASNDVREQLFFAMAEAGYPIIEMSRSSVSLEEVFMKLTSSVPKSEEGDVIE
jgi:ABC-2 type transport system ATP-binding protein